MSRLQSSDSVSAVTFPFMCNCKTPFKRQEEITQHGSLIRTTSTGAPAYSTFSYVPPSVLDGGVPVDVGQQAEAEAVLVVGRVREAVHQDAAGRRVECLPDPVVELVVRH